MEGGRVGKMEGRKESELVKTIIHRNGHQTLTSGIHVQ